MSEPQHILVIRRDNIGDLVCTTPLFPILRANHPAAHISVLANSYNADVLQGNPDINTVHIYTKAKHRKNKTLLDVYWQRSQLIRQLRQQKIDLAILATPSPDKNGYRLARQVKARQIIGVGNGSLKLHQSIDPAKMHNRHQVERVLIAAGVDPDNTPIPPVKVFASPEEKIWAQQQLAAANCTDNNPIGIHISARKPHNRWPVDYFVDLITLLLGTTGKSVVLFWSPGTKNNARHPGDDEKARKILRQISNPRLIGFPTTELRQLVAGLSQLGVLLCSDGGAMHIAAGLKCPVVCLFGYQGAQQWRPWGEHTLFYAEPLSSITADRAYGAIIRYI